MSWSNTAAQRAFDRLHALEDEHVDMLQFFSNREEWDNYGHYLKELRQIRDGIDYIGRNYDVR